MLASADRSRFGASTGAYYLCFYAYTPFSARLTTSEAALGKRFDIKDGYVKTQVISGNDYIYARYKNTDFNKDGTIQFYVEAQSVDSSSNEEPPTIYYKVCGDSDYDNCALSAGEIAGMKQPTAAAQGTVLGDSNTASSRIASLSHSPSACPDANSCTYLIAVRNQQSGERVVGLRVTNDVRDPGDVLLTNEYINLVNQS